MAIAKEQIRQIISQNFSKSASKISISNFLYFSTNPRFANASAYNWQDTSHKS